MTTFASALPCSHRSIFDLATRLSRDQKITIGGELDPVDVSFQILVAAFKESQNIVADRFSSLHSLLNEITADLKSWKSENDYRSQCSMVKADNARATRLHHLLQPLPIWINDQTNLPSKGFPINVRDFCALREEKNIGMIVVLLLLASK